MDESRELRKMPRGERCPECGSQRWYLEDGLRVCSRGHQIEGFIQFDVGDELDAGLMGSVAKRAKEIKETERRQLTGQEGRSLYLESLQLILRKQVLFLVNDKGHREELETVVRDLWDLRIRGFSSVAPEPSAVDTGIEMFSSQPSGEEEGKKASWKSRSREKYWDTERGSGWPTPSPTETITLCYLGCILLRIPTTLGELHAWAIRGSFPYSRVFYDLPREMQDRMPSTYATMLKSAAGLGLDGGDLYYKVMDTALSYNLNYAMTFPELNYVPMLVYYTTELALPVEAVVVAKRLAATLGLFFCFPTPKSRVYPIDHPETLLVALLAVSTKLCFPFDSNQLSHLDAGGSILPKFSWHTWRATLLESSSKLKKQAQGRQALDQASPNVVANMNDDEFDAYLAQISSSMTLDNDNAITHFFPVQTEPALPQPVSDTTEEQVHERARQILARAVKPIQHKDLQKDNPGQDETGYEAFRTIEDLSAVPRAFYQAIGDAAGLPLNAIVAVVYTLEQRILSWQRRSRAARDG